MDCYVHVLDGPDAVDSEGDIVGTVVDRDLATCAEDEANEYLNRVVRNLRTSREWSGCLVVVQSAHGDILAEGIV